MFEQRSCWYISDLAITSLQVYHYFKIPTYVEPGPARMTSITTTSLPQFFAVLSRPRSHHHHYHRCHRRHNHNHQLCHCHQQHRRHNHQRCHHRQEARPIGPEGGVVASPLLPEVNFVVMVITIIMMNMILVIVIFLLIIVIIAKAQTAAQVECLFPPRALTKPIPVGLSICAVPQDLADNFLSQVVWKMNLRH